jgi:hypothetical protein
VLAKSSKGNNWRFLVHLHLHLPLHLHLHPPLLICHTDSTASSSISSSSSIVSSSTTTNSITSFSTPTFAVASTSSPTRQEQAKQLGVIDATVFVDTTTSVNNLWRLATNVHTTAAAYATTSAIAGAPGTEPYPAT